MKNQPINKSWAAVVAGVLGLVAGVATGQARTDLPTFEAEASVNITSRSCDPLTGICVNTATGTGYATGLGAITVTAETFRNGPLDPCAPLYGTRTIATNAGSIFLSVSGTGCQNGGGVIDADFNWVVTGGSGAFTNASGSGTETAEIAFAPFQEHYSGSLSY